MAGPGTVVVWRLVAVLVAGLAVAHARPSFFGGCAISSGFQAMGGQFSASVGASGACAVMNLPASYTPGQTYSVTYTSSCNGGLLNFNKGLLSGSSGSCQSHGWAGATPGVTSFTRTWTAPIIASGNVEVRLACGDNSGCRPNFPIATYTIAAPAVDCLSPPAVANAASVCSSASTLSPACAVTCMPGFRLANTLVCTGSGSFGGSASCSEINACLNNPCGLNEACTDLPGQGDVPAGRNCACATGFGANRTGVCVDIDACALLACDANADCTDRGPPALGDASGRTCVCRAGYGGDGETCADLDACSITPCGGNTSCVDQPPPADAAGRTCACLDGFEGDTLAGCTPIDGCAVSPCHPNATCTDLTTGSDRLCACNLGHAGDGLSCVEIDACLANPCAGNATCTDKPPPALDAASDRACACDPDYFGDGAASCSACSVCAANEYPMGSCSLADHVCVACPPNSTSSAGSASVADCACIDSFADVDPSAGVTCQEITCPAEEFLVGVSCTPCPLSDCPSGEQLVGICAGSTNSRACVPCAATDFRAGVGTACQPCPSGTQANATRDGCQGCPEGTAGIGGQCAPCPAGDQPSTAKDACVPCPTGQSKAGVGGLCAPCPDGMQPTGDRTGCMACPAGTAGLAGICAACGGGDGPNAMRTACEACPPGTSSTAGQCQPCGVAEAAGAGSMTCEQCSDGTEPNGAQSACIECQGDLVGTGGACDVSCAASARVPNASRTACVGCPAPLIPVNANTECGCPAGQLQFGDACIVCAANQILTGGTCETCSGRTAPSGARDECVPCSATERSDGQGLCLPCPDGTRPRAIVAGSPEACEPCPAPTVGLQGQCNFMCPAGTEPNAARTSCILCTGERASQTGSCRLCDLGAQPNAGKTACELCRGDTYGISPSVCGPCPAGLSPAADRLSCVPDASFIVFLPTAYAANSLEAAASQTSTTNSLRAEIERLTAEDASDITAEFSDAGACTMVFLVGSEAILLEMQTTLATGQFVVNTPAGVDVPVASTCGEALTFFASASTAGGPTGVAASGGSGGDDEISTGILIVIFVAVFALAFVLVEVAMFFFRQQGTSAVGASA